MPSIFISRRNADFTGAQPGRGSHCASDPRIKLEESRRNRSAQMNRQVYESDGPGTSPSIEGCEPILYPAPIPGRPFILHLVMARGVSIAEVFSALRGADVVLQTSIVSTTKASTETFLLSDGRPGHYNVHVGGARCVAHLLRHEPQHSGHEGAFATGYSSFLCGSRGGCVSRVVLQGSFKNTPVVVSRSYSSDCHKVFKNKRCWVPARRAPASNRVCACRRPPLLEAGPSAGLLFSAPAEAKELSLAVAPCVECESGLAREVKTLRDSVEAASAQRGFSGAEGSESLEKYHAQRFRLVSRFTQELSLSRQAWFSICPEEISRHIARRVVSLSRKLGRKIRVFDPFCGAGGNIVQAALMDEVSHAFASDISASEVQCANRMADLYGVPRSKMSFRVSDIFHMETGMFKEPVDAIICSPPWGGPAYLTGVYDLTRMNPSYDRILKHCARFTRNLALLLPRTVAVDQLAGTAGAAGSVQGVELELNFLAGKIKTSTAYYGDLINNH